MFQTKLYKTCRGNQNTHFMFDNLFFFLNCAVYEIMWKNIVRAGQVTDDNITQRMHIACLIPKATHTHSEYVIIIALPLLTFLRECALVLHYM